MNTPNTKQIFETLGILAVIFSLLFVALEIRQSNRIAIGNASMELNRMQADLNDSFHQNSDMAVLAAKLSLNESELSEIETQLADALAYKYLNLWGAAVRLGQNGLIDETSIENFLAGIEIEMSRFPGLVPFFIKLSQRYDEAPIRNSGLMERILEATEVYQGKSNQ